MNRSDPGENPDKLDRFLASLPEQPVPADLAAKIYSHVMAHHKRHQALHFGASLLLALIGSWLALPGLAETMQNLALPDSGWQVVATLVDLAGTGAARMSADLIAGLSAYQAGLRSPLNGMAWIGILALAGGCLIALVQMLPDRQL